MVRGALRTPYRCHDAGAWPLLGLLEARVAETLILKGVRHPRDLHADPMANPWPELGLLSITCCSCSRCVPGRINSRPAGGGGVGRAESGRLPGQGGGGEGQSPEQCVPSPCRLHPLPCHVLLCFRGQSRLLMCSLSDASAPFRFSVPRRPV